MKFLLTQQSSALIRWIQDTAVFYPTSSLITSTSHPEYKILIRRLHEGQQGSDSWKPLLWSSHKFGSPSMDHAKKKSNACIITSKSRLIIQHQSMSFWKHLYPDTTDINMLLRTENVKCCILLNVLLNISIFRGTTQVFIRIHSISNSGQWPSHHSNLSCHFQEDVHYVFLIFTTPPVIRWQHFHRDECCCALRSQRSSAAHRQQIENLKSYK